MATRTMTFAAAGALNLDVSTDRYEVRFAQTQQEIESALRLRYEVFNLELANEQPAENADGLEFDKFDYRCRHLLVIEKKTQETVGTYRVNSIDNADNVRDFYSYSEFSIEDLPSDVLERSVEIGRACIAAGHRNSKVLFLLWRGLAVYLKETEKRFLFGCCSIFTTDQNVGIKAFQQLKDIECLHKNYHVNPRDDKACGPEPDAVIDKSTSLELPSLFNMYLRIGAKVCGSPVVDLEFGTIDFFVIFDLQTLNGKYRQLFLGE